MDEEFFKRYAKEHDVTGIPGLEMNQPMASTNQQGMLGLELEIEGRRLLNDGFVKTKTSRGTGWVAVQDGSLRGEAREYIFSQAANMDEIAPLVYGLYKELGENGAVLDLSNRCSTHVHYNMRGRTVNTLTSAIALWIMFEEVLIPWCGEERVANHFCLSTRDAPASLLPVWERYLKTGDTAWGRNLKYSALNILPIQDKGSFEIRCGPLPKDADTVLTWAGAVYDLMEYSNRYENPQELARDVSERGGHDIFNDIFKLDRFKEEVLHHAGGSAAMDWSVLQAFRRVQRICLGFPWPEWIELIKKEYVPNPFGKKKPRVRRPRVEVALGRAADIDRRRDDLADDLNEDGERIVRQDEERLNLEQLRHQIIRNELPPVQAPVPQPPPGQPVQFRTRVWTNPGDNVA